MSPTGFPWEWECIRNGTKNGNDQVRIGWNGNSALFECLVMLNNFAMSYYLLSRLRSSYNKLACQIYIRCVDVVVRHCQVFHFQSTQNGTV